MYKGFYYIGYGPHQGKCGECIAVMEENGEVKIATILSGRELCDVIPEEVFPMPITQGYIDMGSKQ